MRPLPLPIRIAAGLVATAVENARDLPRLALEFPITAVSQALQVTMRVQQKVTELAIKGDRVLGTLRPVEERPSWATFDEEEPPHRNGTGTIAEFPRPRERAEAPRPAVEEAESTARAVAAETTAAAAAGQTAGLEAQGPERAEGTAEGVAAETTAAAAAGRTGGEAATGEESTEAGGPNMLPGYREMTIPQLRGHLRFLSLEDLRALLAWEQAHENRPPYVTMLTNRITTVMEG
ncbi:MAG TPA: lipid droplet-associated protein [Pseudonocardia sp.]|nr:lipid droplet-associated protein [Pseudonocardia sp.]